MFGSGPGGSVLSYSQLKSSPDSLCSQGRTAAPCERTKAEDDGEASDGNEQEPGNMRRYGRRRRGVRGFTGSGAG